MSNNNSKKILLGMPADNFADNDLLFGESSDVKLSSLVEWYVNSDFVKKSYPNDSSYLSVPGQYDVSKWMQSLKDLYNMQASGYDRSDALEKVSSGWNSSEKINFLSWLKFYESNDHLKYKKAFWDHGSGQEYFLATGPYKAPENLPPAKSLLDVNESKDDLEQLSAKEKKTIIENQRKKVVSRLDSVEKLIRSDAGQLLSGEEYDNLIQSIYELKRKINKINKVSRSSKTFVDLIERQGNILSKKGYDNSADILYKIAQDVSAAPPPASPPEPTQNVGNPGTLPSDGPATTGVGNNGVDLSDGLKKFLDNLKTNNMTDVEDLEDEEDVLEVFDDYFADDSDDELLYADAQAVQQPIVKQPPPSKTDTKQAPEAESMSTLKDVDRIIDGALASISVNDLVNKLQHLAKLFKTREIPRQLAIVDLMMHNLGIAPYFNNLSECINKATESNNYILTRIEDMLGKLTGVVEGGDSGIDLFSNKPETGLVSAVKGLEEKEKTRKQMKKQLADAAIDEQMDTTKEVPDVEIDEEPPSATQPPPPATPPPSQAPAAQPLNNKQVG
jgi:hypothetical protein